MTPPPAPAPAAPLCTRCADTGLVWTRAAGIDACPVCTAVAETAWRIATAARHTIPITGEGKPLRPVTWQDRAKNYPRLVESARKALDGAGQRVWF